MKKQKFSVLLAVTLLFVGFTLGFFLGRSQNTDGIHISVSAVEQTAPTRPPVSIEGTEYTAETAATVPETTDAVVFPININTAGQTEWMALPGIGEVLAQRIMAYRSSIGSFSSVEELMNVEGIGEKRMENILEFITIGE